jgi:carboxyl-terminal processing protease
MNIKAFVRHVGVAAALCSLAAGPSLAQQLAARPTGATAGTDNIASTVWADASAGKFDAALDRLRALPAGNADVAALRALPLTFDQAVAKREEQRKAKLEENRTKLDAELAKGDDPEAMSDAIRYAIGIQTLGNDKAGVLAEDRIKALIPKAEAAAKAAEARGDWFQANELYYRLNILLEDTQPYREDVKRLNQRLTMLRLFVPERFWKLRNDERLKEKKSPLPPYNDLGEKWQDKLVGVNPFIVVRSINTAAEAHFDPDMRRRGDLLAAGLTSVRTMITTTDLEPVFPGLGDKTARDQILSYIDQQTGRLRDLGSTASAGEVAATVEGLLNLNDRTVKLPPAAVLHQFGDGAMDHLDEFSAIIWPDELARFERMTQGKFEGVGIQIQMDEESQLIKVVIPLEGTPAQKAGVRPGDLLKKINDKSAVGLTLNQAVDQITGPSGTSVSITVDRPVKDAAPGAPETEEKSFTLTRTNIPLAATKGWRKTGPKDSQWDYFIDPASHIGYVRILQFTPETADELKTAIKKMQAAPGGLAGLIVDLRGNPGGLLEQARLVAGIFVESGPIVYAGSTTESASEGGFKLRNTPMVVLVNEGSASASEIVSGALKQYAAKGQLQCVLMGQRTYGKGSVQNVWDLHPIADAAVKITTTLYRLPDKSIIHRKPGVPGWGVEPNVEIEMLPEQITKAFELRQDADVWSFGPDGKLLPGVAKAAPNPDDLLTDGLDLQLKAALVLLQSQTAGATRSAAATPAR